MGPYSVAFQYRGANDEKGPNEVLFWLIIDSFVDVIFIADIGKVIETLKSPFNSPFKF